MAEVVLDRVSKRFGEVVAVGDLSLTVGDAELIVLLGPTGAGRTTTLRLIAGLSPEIEPSPARIAEVQDLASKNGITTIFFETLASPAMATSIAGDLHLATDVLDPIEGLTKESRGTNYLEIMSSNLTALRTANGCQ